MSGSMFSVRLRVIPIHLYCNKHEVQGSDSVIVFNIKVVTSIKLRVRYLHLGLRL